MQNLPEAQAILSGMTVKELREIARDIHKAANDVTIPGYTKMVKAELVRMLSFEDAWMFAEMRINLMNDDADEREMNEIRAEIAEEAAYIEEGIEIDEADAAEQVDRASYYSGTVPCFERTTVDGIGYGCVKLGEHVEHNTALGAAWWTPTDADEQADTEAGELLDAVLGEPMESSVTVTVNRYTEGRASVTMKGHAFGDMTREAYRIGRKWELVDQEHGHVFATVRAGSLHKVVKAWAKKLGTRAAQIDVARSF